jgi:ubiquitin-like protein Pup
MITTKRSLERTSHEAPLYSAADSTQKQKPNKGGGDSEAQAKGGDGTKKIAKKGKELKEDMDSLMEDIDSVLEENAEEFVKNYVQRGGE